MGDARDLQVFVQRSLQQIRMLGRSGYGQSWVLVSNREYENRDGGLENRPHYSIDYEQRIGRWYSVAADTVNPNSQYRIGYCRNDFLMGVYTEPGTVFRSK